MNLWVVLKRSAKSAIRWVAPAIAMLMLASCGGSSSSSSDGSGGGLPPTTTGSIMWSINDAAGDFVSYVVTVDQIKLTRDDGTVVQALPSPLTLDLAQLVNASEIFGSAQLPSGTYTSMVITLNYSNAAISAENNQGQVVDLTPVTQSGATAGSMDVTLQFPTTSALTVVQGTPLLASLDFDLAASNSVDFTTTPPSVTVSPVLYAVANPADLPYSRASGKLTGVDVTASTYAIDIYPLFYTGNNEFGSLTVATDAQTAFVLDGTEYTGAPGLQAMNTLAAGTATLAYGNYSAADHRFEANEVYAGSSVPGIDSDVVHGSVIARSGNLLTVRGLTYIHASGDTLYHTTVAVTLGGNTLVYKAGDPSAQVGIDDVSVGQQVVILGTLTDTTPTSLAMDAGASATGFVRLAPSEVTGTLVLINTGQVVLDLAEINHHSVSWFDFTGTGSDASHDADPANYQVDTGTLVLSDITAGEPADMTGFVETFGQAPPDFNAESIGNYTTKGAMLMVAWRPNGTTAPFSTQTNSQLVINLQDPNIGPFAVLRRGGPPVDLTTLPASPAIVPPSGGTGLFAIRNAGTVTIYVGFSAFVSALQSHLAGSTTMIGFTARGGYDTQSNTFTATRVAVNLR